MSMLFTFSMRISFIKIRVLGSESIIFYDQLWILIGFIQSNKIIDVNRFFTWKKN